MKTTVNNQSTDLQMISADDVKATSCVTEVGARAVATGGGGYIGIYTPNQSTLNFFLFFCLLAMTS